MENVNGEVGFPAAEGAQATGDGGAGIGDGLRAFSIEAIEAVIDFGAGGFDAGVGVDDAEGNGAAAHGEVEDGTLGGCAVEGVRGDPHFTHGVFFESGGGLCGGR